ncbi:hypothetical protein E4U36_004343 [Claviceps purpurea]|nr:hypothetical protein E4U36_004343 [Claviceps purpurea]KAG6300009.1 hypothetical protein E4U45_004205 [Claviceps purpurea]
MHKSTEQQQQPVRTPETGRGKQEKEEKEERRGEAGAVAGPSPQNKRTPLHGFPVLSFATDIRIETRARNTKMAYLLTWVTRVCQALGVYFYVPDGNRRNTPRKPASDAGAVEVQ